MTNPLIFHIKKAPISGAIDFILFFLRRIFLCFSY